jgi:hypothetical protein
MSAAQIDVVLKWSETNPGWIAEAYCREFRDAAHVRAKGDVGGFSPMKSIMEAVDQIARQINCHPTNIEMLIKVDGAELFTAGRRESRL